MNLKTLLLEKKPQVLKKWFDVIIETYPSETTRELRKQDDPFTNPIGYHIIQGIDGIFRELIEGTDIENVSPFLDSIIRIRAVQDFTPSQAISFIFLLKKVIREELKSEIHKGMIYKELLALESTIDDMTLFCFDLYMKCREKIYELKANEVRNMTFRLLERANQIHSTEER